MKQASSTFSNSHSLFNGFEVSEMPRFPVGTYARLPFPVPFVERYSTEAGFIQAMHLAIRPVLRCCGFSKVSNAVIVRNTIDVIDVFLNRPMNESPCKPMGAVMSSINSDTAISVAINLPGDLAAIPTADFDFPGESACVEIVV